MLFSSHLCAWPVFYVCKAYCVCCEDLILDPELIFNSELVVIAPRVSYSQTLTLNGVTLCEEIVSPECDPFQV